MVTNLKCELSGNAKDAPVFRLTWKWVITDDNTLPALRVLYRPVKEDEMISNSLFTEDLFASYLGNDIRYVDANALDSERLYNELCCALRHGDPIRHEIEIEIDQSCCFYFFHLICNSGNHQCSFARTALADSEVEYATRKTLLGNVRIALKDHDARRVFLKTEHAGCQSFSLLPTGKKEYHLNPETKDFQLIYLASLINNI